MSEVLVLVDHVDGAVKKVTLELLTAARALGEPSAVVVGAPGTAGKLKESLASYGAAKVYVAESEDATAYLVTPKVDALAPERLYQKLFALTWQRLAHEKGSSQPRYAFVHGNFALANSAGGRFCGVDSEMKVLAETGCYADFTFPAFGSPAQPRKSNSIYYATDDAGPKSYDRGNDVAVGRPASGDLMIFQGPLVIDCTRGRFEDSRVSKTAKGSKWDCIGQFRQGFLRASLYRYPRKCHRPHPEIYRRLRSVGRAVGGSLHLQPVVPVRNQPIRV